MQNLFERAKMCEKLFWLIIKLFYKHNIFLAWYPRVLLVMTHLLYWDWKLHKRWHNTIWPKGHVEVINSFWNLKSQTKKIIKEHGYWSKSKFYNPKHDKILFFTLKIELHIFYKAYWCAPLPSHNIIYFKQQRCFRSWLPTCLNVEPLRR